MPTAVALTLLQKFRQLGAIKVSFLGGEPTLYGQEEGNESLGYLIQAAREMGFEYIRIVTNGTFDAALLQDDRLKAIDEITFSIDGDTAEIHNKLRGRLSYEKAMAALRAAIRMNYTAHITMCVHRGNVGRTDEGILILARAINWAEALGVRSFNVHPLLRMGVARDAWTGETDVDPDEWIAVYREVRTSIKRGDYKIPVRIPMRLVTNGDFASQPQRYGYCSVKSADRLDVHPNGQMHICALHSGTPVSIASFEAGDDDLRIHWTSLGNELDENSFVEGENQACPVMRGFPGILKPLCISLKPGQDEFVWNRMGLT